jgi:hypothetical protein
MIKAIHQSMLNSAFRCGESFRRRYVENEIIPPGVAAGRGTGLHFANKVNLTQKIKSGEDLPLTDIQDAARDGYVNAFKDGVYIPQEQVSEKDRLLTQGLDDAVRCATVYREKVSPGIQPKAVEQPFVLDMGLALPLSGTVDIERVAKVDDLKSAGKTWAKDQIHKEIQPIMYSFAHEKLTGDRPVFQYHIMICRRGAGGFATSTGYEVQAKICTDQDYAALRAQTGVFIDMFQKGVFVPANPSSWWCSPEWCGYYRTCPYRGHGKQSTWV